MFDVNPMSFQEQNQTSYASMRRLIEVNKLRMRIGQIRKVEHHITLNNIIDVSL